MSVVGEGGKEKISKTCEDGKGEFKRKEGERVGVGLGI